MTGPGRLERVALMLFLLGLAALVGVGTWALTAETTGAAAAGSQARLGRAVATFAARLDRDVALPACARPDSTRVRVPAAACQVPVARPVPLLLAGGNTVSFIAAASGPHGPAAELVQLEATTAGIRLSVYPALPGVTGVDAGFAGRADFAGTPQQDITAGGRPTGTLVRYFDAAGSELLPDTAGWLTGPQRARVQVLRLHAALRYADGTGRSIDLAVPLNRQDRR